MTYILWTGEQGRWHPNGKWRWWKNRFLMSCIVVRETKLGSPTGLDVFIGSQIRFRDMQKSRGAWGRVKRTRLCSDKLEGGGWNRELRCVQAPETSKHGQMPSPLRLGERKSCLKETYGRVCSTGSRFQHTQFIMARKLWWGAGGGWSHCTHDLPWGHHTAYTDKHICVFLKCQELLKNNKFTRLMGFNENNL